MHALAIAALAAGTLYHGEFTGAVSYIPDGPLEPTWCHQVGESFTVEFEAEYRLNTPPVNNEYFNKKLINVAFNGQPEALGATTLHIDSDLLGPQYTLHGSYGDAQTFRFHGEPRAGASWGGIGCWGHATTTLDLTVFTAGDSNLDEVFDSGDLVQVFTAGEYEDTLIRNSTWRTGDWTADQEFTSSDLVYAMTTTPYMRAAAPVPEPSSIMLFLVGLAAVRGKKRHISR